MVLKNIRASPNSEVVKLTDSLGRILAKDIYSGIDIPSFDNSAMDGYAVRASDTFSVSKEKGKTLRVIEDVKAGFIAKKILKSGQAIRIMTGASVPKCADSVVMVEDTRPEGKYVEIFKEVEPEENIRKKGEDIKKGRCIIRKGTLLKPAHIGVMASLGISKVEVSKKPKIAVLATGDELVDVHEKLTPGKIRSSNTYSLYSQIVNCGGIPKNLGIAKDQPNKLKAKIKEGLNCDLILTSGGVSVGDYDLVKLVLAEMGTDIKFWQVAMRPGKPLVFGRIKGVPVFGLPGNPVSSMVSFEIFVKPAIIKMLGQGGDYRNAVNAILEEKITKKKGLKYFLRAKTRWENGIYVTRTTGAQGSGILKSMALANSLIILPEEKKHIKKGEEVTVWFLN